MTIINKKNRYLTLALIAKSARTNWNSKRRYS